MFTLYHNDMSVCAQKVRMALCTKEIEWQSVHLNLREGEQHQPSFRKLNPKGMVPVLVDGDGANEKVILESTAIVEYIDEKFPDKPLFPVDLSERAKVRWWGIQLDANLHYSVAVISFCLVFRLQVLRQYESQEALDEFISKIPDPSRQDFMRDILPNGVKSKRLEFAVFAYDKLLSDMSKALKSGDYLVGDVLSAADIAYIPYLDRLDQLGLSQWWHDKPEINDWIARVRATDGYIQGIEKWLNPKYIEIMSGLSENSWDAVKKLI